MITLKAMFSEVTSRPTSRLVFGSRLVAYIIEKECLYLAPRKLNKQFYEYSAIQRA